MSRYNDLSDNMERWTNAKLMREARRLANMENFGSGHYDGPEIYFRPGWANQNGSADIGDFCREQTRIYRDSWLQPVLDEIERRFVKVK